MSRKRPRAAPWNINTPADNAAANFGMCTETVVASVTSNVYDSSSDMDDDDLDRKSRDDRKSGSSSSSAKRRKSVYHAIDREDAIFGSAGTSGLFSPRPQVESDVDTIPSAISMPSEPSVKREEVCTFEDWVHLKEQFNLAEDAYAKGQFRAALIILLSVLQECARFMQFCADPSAIFSVPSFDSSSRDRTYSTFSHSEPMTPTEERLFRDWDRDPKYLENRDDFEESENVDDEEDVGASRRSRSSSSSRRGSRSRSLNRGSLKSGARSRSRSPIHDPPTAYHTLLGTSLLHMGDLLSFNPSLAQSYSQEQMETDPTRYYLKALEIFEAGEILSSRTHPIDRIDMRIQSVRDSTTAASAMSTTSAMGLASNASTNNRTGRKEDWCMSMSWGRTLIRIARLKVEGRTIYPLDDKSFSQFRFQPRRGIPSHSRSCPPLLRANSNRSILPHISQAVTASAHDIMLLAADQFSRGIFHMPHASQHRTDHRRRSGNTAFEQNKELLASSRALKDFSSLPNIDDADSLAGTLNISTFLLTAVTLNVSSISAGSILSAGPSPITFPTIYTSPEKLSPFYHLSTLFSIAKDVADVSELLEESSQKEYWAQWADGILSQILLNTPEPSVGGASGNVQSDPFDRPSILSAFGMSATATTLHNSLTGVNAYVSSINNCLSVRPPITIPTNEPVVDHLFIASSSSGVSPPGESTTGGLTPLPSPPIPIAQFNETDVAVLRRRVFAARGRCWLIIGTARVELLQAAFASSLPDKSSSSKMSGIEWSGDTPSGSSRTNYTDEMLKSEEATDARRALHRAIEQLEYALKSFSQSVVSWRLESTTHNFAEKDIIGHLIKALKIIASITSDHKIHEQLSAQIIALSARLGRFEPQHKSSVIHESS